MNRATATMTPTGQDRAQARRLLRLHDGLRAFPYLVARGDAVIPLLEPLLRGPPETIFEPRCRVAHVLGRVGGAKAIDALARAFKDAVARKLDPVLDAAEAAVINCIAENLARLRAENARQFLFEALMQRPYAGVIRALAALNEPRAIAWIVPALSDDLAREAAASALRRFGRAAVPTLVAYLVETGNRSADRGREEAACLLAALAGQSAIPPLRVALRDPVARVRLAAALALAGLPPGPQEASEIVPILIAFLDHDDDGIVEASMQGLLQVRGTSEPLLCARLDANARDEVALRRNLRLVALLEKIASPAALNAIGRLWASPDLRVRFRALSALTRTRAPGDAGHIAGFLRDPSPLLRDHAVAALRERGVTDVAEPAAGGHLKWLRRITERFRRRRRKPRDGGIDAG